MVNDTARKSDIAIPKKKQIIRGIEEQPKMGEEERIVRQHERDIADIKDFQY